MPVQRGDTVKHLTELRTAIDERCTLLKNSVDQLDSRRQVRLRCNQRRGETSNVTTGTGQVVRIMWCSFSQQIGQF